MKKQKIFLLLAMLVLLFACLSLTALAAADGDTADVSGFSEASYTYRVDDGKGGASVYYINLDVAFAAVPNGGTLTMLKNDSFSGTKEMSNANSFTFDGNGKSLTAGTKLQPTATCTGQIDFKNLTITSSSNYLIDHYGTATLTFTGCTLSTTQYAVHIRKAATIKFLGNANSVTATNTGTSAYLLLTTGSNAAKGGAFVIEGGTFTAKGGSVFYTPSQASITVSNAVLSAGAGMPAIYNYVGGTNDTEAGVSISIRNTTVYGVGTLALRQGTLASVTLESVTHTAKAQSGSNASVAPNYIVNVQATSGAIGSLTIKDCTFAAAEEVVLAARSVNPTVIGGTYTITDITKQVFLFQAPCNLTVDGGTFVAGRTMPLVYYYGVTDTTAVTADIRNATVYGLGILAVRSGTVSLATLDNVTFRSTEQGNDVYPGYVARIQETGVLNELVMRGCSIRLSDSAVSTGKALTVTVEGGRYELPRFDTVTDGAAVGITVADGIFVANGAKVESVFFSGTVAFEGGALLSYGNLLNVEEGLAMPLHVSVFYGGTAYTAYFAAEGTGAPYNPANANPEFDGAAVYLGSDLAGSGLRFITELSDEMIEAAFEARVAGKSVQYGTVIAPADYVLAAGKFTMQALDELPIAETKVVYVKIPAVHTLVTNEMGEVAAFSGALVSVKEANYNRAFAAVSYVEIDGEIYYGDTNAVDNARSMAAIAAAALESGKAYSENEVKLLEKYAAKKTLDLFLIAGQSNAAGTSIFNSSFAATNSKFTEGYENIGYFGASTNGTSSFTHHRIVADSVKIGYGVSDTQFGPELGMADVLSTVYNAESGRTAAFVRYAWGGTVLVDHTVAHGEGNWCPPSYLEYMESNGESPMNATKTGQLYYRFINNFRSSVAYYENCGYDVNVVCLYWMQGESDIEYVAEYKEIFSYLVSDLRADISAITGEAKDAEMPVFVGEITRAFDAKPEQSAAFIEMQNTLTEIPNVFVVEQSKMAVGNDSGDNAHWGAENMLLVGQVVGTTIYNALLADGEPLPSPYLTGTPVAEVYGANGQLVASYANLTYALGVAPEGGTVKLLTDLTVYGPIATNNPATYTLDGNGKTITCTSTEGGALRIYDGNVTVLNLHVRYPSKTGATGAVAILSGADVTWQGGSVVGGDIAFRIYQQDTVLTVKSGEFSTLASDYKTYGVVTSASAGSVVIEGGTFTGSGVGAALYFNGAASVTVSGGTFTGGPSAAATITLTNAESSLTVTGTPTINGTVSNAGTGYSQ